MRQHFGYSKADLVEPQPFSARCPRNGRRLLPRQGLRAWTFRPPLWFRDEIIVAGGVGRHNVVGGGGWGGNLGGGFPPAGRAVRRRCDATPPCWQVSCRPAGSQRRAKVI